MQLNLDRRSAGQWMTDGDPFYMPVFAEWLDGVYSKIGKARISACEPYAGKLGLVAHLRARGLDDGRIDWSAYDIAPQDELLADGIEIAHANTLRSIPSSPYDLIVTNPRTSPATRQDAATCRSHSMREGQESRSLRIYTNSLSTHASNRHRTA